MALAWHIVAFDRTKRLKPLGEYIARRPKASRAQTVDEQFSVAQRWVAAGFGTMQ